MGGHEALRKVIYASRATGEPTEDDLLDLLQQARDRNRRLGLTGMLIYAERSFLQQLEGDEPAVGEVLASIQVDPRHTDIRMLADEPVTARRFASWSMGFEHVDQERLRSSVDGFRSADPYPLVNSQLVRNPTVAETLLELFGRNP